MKFILCLIFLLPIPAEALTLSGIRDLCRLYARDTGSTRLRLTDSQYNSIIEEGHKEIVQSLLPIVKSFRFELVSGTTYYTLPRDYLIAFRVTRDYQYLSEKSPKALDKYSNWEEVSGRPSDYFISFASRTLIGMYPWPSTSSDTGTVRMEYYATATALTTDSQSPFNGIQELQPYGNTLVQYCAYRAALLNGEPDLATFYYQEYRLSMSLMDSTDKSRPSYSPSITPATPNNPGFR